MILSGVSVPCFPPAKAPGVRVPRAGSASTVGREALGRPPPMLPRRDCVAVTVPGAVREAAGAPLAVPIDEPEPERAEAVPCDGIGTLELGEFGIAVKASEPLALRPWSEPTASGMSESSGSGLATVEPSVSPDGRSAPEGLLRRERGSTMPMPGEGTRAGIASGAPL